MGQEIFYCCRCRTQLRSRDFEKAAAFHIDAQVCCRNCAPDVLKSLSGEAAVNLLKQMSPPPHPESTRKPSETSRTLAAVTSTARMPTALPASSGKPGLALAVGAGALLLLGLGWLSGNSKPERPDAPRVAPAPAPAPETAVVPPPPKPPEPGVDALRQARDYVRTNPADLAGQAAFYEQALAALKGSPNLEEAKRELETLRKSGRERVAADLAALDLKIREVHAREEFDEALELVALARRKMNSPDWTAGLDQRGGNLQRLARELYKAVKEGALDAQKRGAKEGVQAARDRVARWGLPDLIADLGKALDAAAAPPPEPKDPSRSPEALAWASCRDRALLHARARDFPAAQAELQKGLEAVRDDSIRKSAAEDEDLFKQAGAAFKEFQQLVSKWKKGQRVSLEYVNGAGQVDRLDGPIVRMDPYRLEVKGGGDAVVVPIGEFRGASMAAALKDAQAAPSPKALAFLSQIDGDGAADAAARSLYFAAERTAEDPATAVDAVQKIASLLKDHGDTGFVRRNRPLLLARSQGGKDYFIFPEDMTGTAPFVRAKNPKTESCLSLESDVDPAKTRDTYVEVSWSALPETEYRCWVYVGACCAETFAFAYQATGLVGPKDSGPCEPGSPSFVASKAVISAVKKSHAAHGGPKAPSRWEWIPVPLPKSGAPGPRKLRLLSTQQGFSVSYAVISAVRSAPPRDPEIKSIEKARIETPGGKPLNREAPSVTFKVAPKEEILFSVDFEDGKPPPNLSIGTVEKGPELAGNKFCWAGSAEAGVSRMMFGAGNVVLFVCGPDDSISFDYWMDAGGNAISFNVAERTQGKQYFGAVPKLTQGKWTRFTGRMAELTDPSGTAHPGPGNEFTAFYIQATGAQSVKLYIDNLQFTRPRAQK